MTAYLIGGPPKCGKTTLAKTMGERFSIRQISVDALEDAVMAGTPKQDFPALFPHACTKGDSNDTFYANHPTDRIVRDYVLQGHATRESVLETIGQASRNNEDLIIEGHQLSPEFVRLIANTHDIRALFLLKLDAAKMIRDFHKSTTPDDWILRKTRNEETFSKIAEMIVLYSGYFESEARRYGFDTIRMDDRFEQGITEAMNLLTKAGSDSSAAP